jgi:hypothetical protein
MNLNISRVSIYITMVTTECYLIGKQWNYVWTEDENIWVNVHGCNNGNGRRANMNQILEKQIL